MSESGIRKLAFDLFKSEGHAALREARSLVTHYRNGANASQVMEAIRQSKIKLGIPACSKLFAQAQLNGPLATSKTESLFETDDSAHTSTNSK